MSTARAKGPAQNAELLRDILVLDIVATAESLGQPRQRLAVIAACLKAAGVQLE